MVKLKLMGLFIMLVIISGIAFAAQFPPENIDPYYDDLADFTNVSLDSTTGQLWKELNASFYDFNVTNSLIALNGNFTYLNISNDLIVLGNIYGEIPDAIKNSNITALILSQLSTNISNGNLLIPSNTSWWTNLYDLRIDRFGNENATSDYLTNLALNISNGNLIVPSNTSWVISLLTDTNIPNDLTIETTNNILIGGGFASGGITIETDGDIFMNGSLYIIGNISNVDISNININGSLYPSLDNVFDIGSKDLRWKNINATGTIESDSLTSPTVRITNLQDLDSSSFFDLTGCGTSATFTAIDSTGAVTCSDISITESQISDLKSYQVEANAYTFANNETFVLDNTTIIRDNNLASKIQNSTINRSIDLSSYNKSIDLSSYNQSIDLSNYLTSQSTTNSTSWNRTSTNVILANTGDNVGIGTTSPGVGLHLVQDITGTNTNSEIMRFTRSSSSGAGAAGLGGYISGYLEDGSSNIVEAGRMGFSTRTATAGNAYASEFVLRTERETYADMLDVLTAYADSSNKWICGNSNKGGDGYDCFGFTIGSGNDIALTYDGTKRVEWNYGTTANTFETKASSGVDMKFTTLGTNPMYFDTSNNGADLYITSGGNVGIGTTAPTDKLQVMGNFSVRNQSDASKVFLFVSNATGNVGIGTTSPAHNLHVIGNANITGSFNATRIEANEILVNGAVVNRSIDLSSYNKSIDLSSYNQSIDLSSYNKSISLVNYNQSVDLSQYSLNTWNRTSTNVILANIDDNVGIGTTSPGAKLDIKGTGNLLRLNSSTTNEGIGTLIVGGSEDQFIDNPYLHFNPIFIDNFNGDVSGWSVGSATLTPTENGTMIQDSTGGDPQFQLTTAISFNGSENRIVAFKYRTMNASAANPQILQIFYVTGDHGTSETYTKAGIDLAADGKWHIVALDMTTQTGSINDWVNSTVTNIRLDFGTAISSDFEFDWIAIGQPGPGFRRTDTDLIVDGNIGIGTTTMFSKLSFGNVGSFSAATKSFAIHEESDGTFFYGIAGYDPGAAGGSDEGLALYGGTEATVWTSATPHLFIRRNTGNVGIGTTSPGRLLEVAGSINGTQLNISGATNLAYGSGNVGIGTTSPRTLLDVSDQLAFTETYDGNGAYTGDRTAIVLDDTSRRGSIQVRPSGDMIMGIESNDDLLFIQNNAEKARIEIGGNLGIGTTDPTQILAVGAGGNISFQTTSGATGDKGDIRWITEEPYNDLSAYIRAIRQSTAGGRHDLAFGVTASAGSPTIIEAIRIKESTGNVGIGDTTPSQKLTVVGNISLSSGNYIFTHTETDGNWLIGKDNLHDVYITGYGAGGEDRQFIVKDTATGNARMAVDFYSGNVGIGTTSPTDKLQVMGNFSVRNQSDTSKVFLFVSDVTGNVGIGTTAPATTLDVKGAIQNFNTGGFLLNWYDDTNQVGTFNGRQIAQEVVSTIDWGNKNPNSQADYYTMRLVGYVKPAYTETYTFYSTSDDGQRVWVNGVSLIDNWADQGPTERTATIALTGNTWYPIVAEHYENGGGESYKLEWSSASQAREVLGITAANIAYTGWENSPSQFIGGDFTHGVNLATIAGNVGIGTTVPGVKLHVVGEANISGISGDGSGKVVCIKSDRTLGTCSSVVAGDGTCTCG